MQIRPILTACRVAVLVSLLALFTFSLETGPPRASADSVGKVYWTDSGTGKISRANLDGSGAEDLITGLDSPQGIALDSDGGKMYWTETGVASGKISRANLDGTNVEVLIATGCCSGTSFIALDVPGGKMYWTSSFENRVKRANLDGTDAEDFVGANNPNGVAVDASAQKVYWTYVLGGVRRANFDGTAIEDIVTGRSAPIAVALDTTAGRAYFTELLFGLRLNVLNNTIQTYATDGSGGFALYAQSTDGPRGVAVDSAGAVLAWPGSNLGSVRTWNMTSGDFGEIVTGLGEPYGIALDISDAPKPTATQTLTPTITQTSTLTPTITPTPGPLAVGGVGRDQELRALPAATQTSGESGSVALIAGTALMSLATLAGAAWWARRRRIP